MMKIILLGAGVAALLASSAMAQSYDPSVGSGNIVPDTGYGPTGSTVNEPYFGSEPYVGRPIARAYARDSYSPDYASAPRHHLRRHEMQGHSDMDRE